MFLEVEATLDAFGNYFMKVIPQTQGKSTTLLWYLAHIPYSSIDIIDLSSIKGIVIRHPVY